MGGVSIKAIDRDNLLEKMNAVGEDTKGALHAGLKAMGVYVATAIAEASPVDTGDMQASMGVSLNHVEQTAPYTVFVDFRTRHFSGTYERVGAEALEAAAVVANQFLVTGQDARSVPSPWPAQGYFRNTRGRTRYN